MRVATYASAYRLRLIDALAANFPRLQQLLGPEKFSALAHSFIEIHPSQHASVRWFGRQLADYLRNDSEFQQQPWLAELATWEWAIAEAFDAGDATPIAVAALAEITPSQWPQLRLTLHPSLRQLQLTTNAVRLFKSAGTDTDAIAPAMNSCKQDWLIWRQELAVRFRPSSSDEAGALAVLENSGTFESLCASLCNWLAATEVPARAASLLKTWVSEGLIAGYTAQAV